MVYVARIGAPLALIAALAGGCGGSGESRPAGAAGAADSAAQVASAKAAELRISNVMIGRRIGTGNRITEPTFEFAPTDTVYVSVGTEGTGGAATLAAAWRTQTGEILQQSSQPVPGQGENAEFHLAQPKVLKPGTYKVIVFLGDDSVDTKLFAVRK